MARGFPTVSNTFVAATKARSAKVNENFQDLIDALSEGNKDIYVGSIGFGYTSTGSDFVFADDDHVSMLYVSTGASTVTATFPGVTANAGRVIGVKKIDSGAGEIKIVANTTTAKFDDWDYVDVRKQNDVFIFQSDSVAWRFIDWKTTEIIQNTTTGDYTKDMTSASYEEFTSASTQLKPGIWDVSYDIKITNIAAPTSTGEMHDISCNLTLNTAASSNKNFNYAFEQKPYIDASSNWDQSIRASRTHRIEVSPGDSLPTMRMYCAKTGLSSNSYTRLGVVEDFIVKAVRVK